MASSPEQLQALIDALSSYCAMLHMEISVPKTKVMIVSPVPVSAATSHAMAALLSPIDSNFMSQVHLCN